MPVIIARIAPSFGCYDLEPKNQPIFVTQNGKSGRCHGRRLISITISVSDRQSIVRSWQVPFQLSAKEFAVLFSSFFCPWSFLKNKSAGYVSEYLLYSYRTKRKVH